MSEILTERPEGLEPIICDECKEEIKVNEKFIELYYIEGYVPEQERRGYVKGMREPYPLRVIEYVHTKHMNSFGGVSERNIPAEPE